MNKILKFEQLKKMSSEEIINAYKSGYTLETTSECVSCGEIKTLVVTCPSTGKTVGESVTLSMTPTKGTPPYIVWFARNGTMIPDTAFRDVPEGTTKSITYTFVAGDVPSVTLAAAVSDSCATGARACTEKCIVTVSIACTTPLCNFTIS